jgi:hypothetical protein
MFTKAVATWSTQHIECKNHEELTEEDKGLIIESSSKNNFLAKAKGCKELLQLFQQGEVLPLLQEGPEEDGHWLRDYKKADPEQLLKEVKLQILKVVVFVGLVAVLGFLSVALMGFYKHRSWGAAFQSAATASRFPELDLVFDLTFSLPNFFMLDFDFEVTI